MSIIEIPMSISSRACVFVTLFTLILALPAPLVVAQDESVGFDAHPLRPADTSSPRDTLRSFITNVNAAVHSWQAGEPAEARRKSKQRARETFDFSQVPERGKRVRQIENALLMKEILDRIELPRYEDIPGDEEVANKEKAISRWVIPNTRITITRVEKGPRAGEFLFSAETVDRIEEFYEDAKTLPYKPGAHVGIYDDFAHTPGLMLLQSWGTVLPAWSKIVVFGEALWQWLGFLIVVGAAFLVIWSLLRWGRRWDKRRRSDSAIMRFGTPLGVLASVLVIYGCRLVFLFGFRQFLPFRR
jgi:MscS family membrane protein